MLFKVLLCFCLLQVMVYAGTWEKIASYKCVEAKDNKYSEFVYTGPNTYIDRIKLVHKDHQIGCQYDVRTNWGCNGLLPFNIIVTDTANNRIYPSPLLVKTNTGGWYDLPNYNANSLELVFYDAGLRYLYSNTWLRIWYGEDLHDSNEYDNGGKTCMDVWVHKQSCY